MTLGYKFLLFLSFILGYSLCYLICNYSIIEKYLADYRDYKMCRCNIIL
jgi:hypothetical protein